MKIDFNYPTSTYIIAVSGGVDSMVLLDILVKQYPQNTYIVAHINHGIRSTDEAHADYEIVKQCTSKNSLQLEYTELSLGSKASEAEARQKRYSYLYSILQKHTATALITAHHQDDVLETMCMNILRGTGRKGLSSLQSTNNVIRPMLHISKQDIYAYAKKNALPWNEDMTNTDMRYSRNAIRHKVVAHMSHDQRKQLFHYYEVILQTNHYIDKEIDVLLRRGLHKQLPVVDRQWFVRLPHPIAKEVAYSLLKLVGSQDVDTATIERTTIAMKTQRPGKRLQVNNVDVVSTKRSIRFINRSKTDEKSV